MKETKNYIKQTENYGDDVYAAWLMKVTVGDESDDYSRTVDNQIRVGIGTQGYITMQDGDTGQQIFIYSDQLENFKAIIEKAIEIRNEHEKCLDEVAG